MIQEEYLNKFLCMEEKYNLFEIKYQNGCPWHYMRFEIFRYIREMNGLCGRPISFFDQVLPENGWKWKYEKNIKHKSFLLGHKDVVLMTHGRKVFDKGFYRCIYTDIIDKELKLSHYVLDRRQGSTTYFPQKSKNLKYIDYSFDTARANKTEKLNFHIKSFADKFFNPVELEFGISIPFEVKKKWTDYITYLLRIKKGLFQYYRRLFQKIRPKAIIIVVSYSFDMMILCESAKSLKIPVIELQHGTIGGGSIEYNFNKKRRLPSFPDYVFTFSEYDKKNIRFPLPSKNIFAVGFPELENKAMQFSADNKKSRKKTILFISQALPVIAEYADYLADHLDSEKYKIIFKLHPSEFTVWKRDIKPYLKNPCIVIGSNPFKEIYEYLSQADYVVGCCSTVLNEATMFDTEVLVLKEAAYTQIRDLYENNYATLIENRDELVKAVQGKINKTEKKDYFCRDSMKHITKAINQIIALNQGDKN